LLFFFFFFLFVLFFGFFVSSGKSGGHEALLSRRSPLREGGVFDVKRAQDTMMSCRRENGRNDVFGFDVIGFVAFADLGAGIDDLQTACFEIGADRW